MQEICNKELLNSSIEFPVTYRVLVTRIDGDTIPSDKKSQLILHLQRFAFKLGVGSYTKDWVFEMFEKTKVISVSFTVKRELKEMPIHINKINEFIKEVCSFKNMEYDSIFLKKRDRNIVFSRQLVMYFLKTIPSLSLSEIGRIFGGFDHATVLHSHKAISNLIDVDKSVRDDVEYIKCNIANKYF